MFVIEFIELYNFQIAILSSLAGVNIWVIENLSVSLYFVNYSVKR